MIDLYIETENEQNREMCKRYWATEDESDEIEFIGTVSAIAQDYGFNNSMKLLETIREHSTAQLKTVTCKRCGRKPEITSRTDALKTFKQRHRNSSHSPEEGFVCRDCRKEKERERRLQRRQLKENRRARVRKVFQPSNLDRRDPRSWTLRTAVYLLTLVRAGATEKLDLITPVRQQDVPLSPGGLMDQGILEVLSGHDQNLITIHPESDLDCFEFDGLEPNRYHPMCVSWYLNLGLSAQENREAIRELEDIFREMDWPDSWIEESKTLWREVAIHEGIEYLDHKLSQHKLPFDPGERAYGTMENLVQDFSVAQIYNIVWKKAKDAAAWRARTYAPKENATKYAVKAIQGYADKVRSENWNISPYNRDWDCPESMLSKVLYDTVLQIDGFREVPA